MKKIIAASDSFKGSLGSMDVARAIERGVHRVFDSCRVHRIAIADGGEGTVQALVDSLHGEVIAVRVHDPLMRPVEALYGIVDHGRTAVIEMAAASGLPLLAEGERNPMTTTTRGTGEMMVDALRRGCRRLLIGIGGSATNDGGTGMLEALGLRMLDGKGNALPGTGASLAGIESIDSSGALEELAGVEIVVACDVANPFYGPSGAAHVFAPQKGATAPMVEQLDGGLRRFAGVVERTFGIDVQSIPGAGAAGGLGGALAAVLGARMMPGIDMVLEATGFADLLEGADLVITGEGRVDAQTAMGKAPSGVLRAARRAGVPVIAIGGEVERSAALDGEGFAGVFPILPGPSTLARAMEPEFAAANIERTVMQLMIFARNICSRQ
ncbi:glycerate kinase [Bacteroidia bacterium]|nr:glycerate kinase [Bacteroidia bacterium]